MTISVANEGTGPFTYQWRRNGVVVLNSATPSFTIGNAQYSDTADYSVVVSNAVGSTESDVAKIFVGTPATIVTQPPPSQTIPAFSSATISVVALGDPAVAYEWRRNGVVIPGANSATLEIPVATTSDAGSYTVTIANGVTVTSSNSFLTVQKAVQQVEFPPIGARLLEELTVSLFASASSGLPVSYSVISGPATVVGNTLTLSNVGTVTVRATQVGDSDFNAASPVEQSFSVDSLNFSGQAIVFPSIPPKTVVSPPFPLNATATSGLTVSYASSNPAVASVNGDIVTINGLGTATITASQPGDATFLPALEVSQVITVTKASQTINFGSLPNRVFGAPPFALDATASSGLAVTYTSSNPSVASVSGNIVTIVGAGLGGVTIRARQLGDQRYFAAPEVPQYFTVARANQSISFPAPADRPFSLAPIPLPASSTSGLAVTFSVVSGPGAINGSSVLLSGVGNLTIRASQPGNNNFSAATPVERTFAVAPNFDSWRYGRFTTAELADLTISGANAVFGQDGLTNQVKYALGLEPKTNIVSGQPILGSSATEWIYTYTRPDPAPAAIDGYVVEVSTDLQGGGGWTAAGVTHEQLSSIGGIATWRARFPMRTAATPADARVVAFRLKTILGANLSYAPPLAGLTVELPSNETATLGLPLAGLAAGAGAVMGRLTDAGANYAESAGAGWTAGALSDPATPYFLRVRSGVSAGRVLPVTNTPNTDSRIYIDTDGVSLAQSGVVLGANGDAYEILPADTLASTFSGLGLTGGDSAAVADLVQVWSGASWLVFYFNTDRNRWERNVDSAASPSRDSFVLRPDRGILVQRRNAGPATIYLQHRGRVPELAPRSFHARPGTTFLATGVPVDLTLSGLNTSLGVGVAGGWTPANSPVTATSTGDLLLVWSPTGNRWAIHYFDSTNSRWQEAGDGTNTNRNNLVIPAGQAVILRRLGTSDNKFLTLPFPYTIDR